MRGLAGPSGVPALAGGTAGVYVPGALLAFMAHKQVHIGQPDDPVALERVLAREREGELALAV